MEKGYRPKDGDLLLLCWRDGEDPLFDPAMVPAEVKGAAPPEDEGKSSTIFAGATKAGRLMVRAARLDIKNVPVQEAMKRAVSSAIGLAQEERLARVAILLRGEDSSMLAAAQEGALLGGYCFDKYLSEKKEPVPVTICLEQSPTSAIKKQKERLDVICRWINFARDILNEPPNVIHPQSLAKIFREQGKKAGLKVTVWDEKRLEKERCGGILAVGKGAASRPCLVMGEYRPRKAKRHLCLVGKGITFDTGGYCLKPEKSQIGMKYDMGGAAMMFASACAMAELRVPVKVTVLTPLAENDISSTAYHTTDIITTRSGKSVEVDNTDAEGRIILSDALTIACEKGPDWIIDSATLTGACVVALGEDIAGAFGTSDELAELIIEAGAKTGELIWKMPLHMPYFEQMKSTIADMKNIGSRWGGAITAALFLKQFVDDEIPWVHLDIAGPSVKEEPLGHLGKGAKGFGVKTMLALVEQLQK
jgi:leucyl aminopeptidase